MSGVGDGVWYRAVQGHGGVHPWAQARRVLGAPCSSPQLHPGMARMGQQPYRRLSTHTVPFPAIAVPGGQITREETSADPHGASPALLLPLPGAATRHQLTQVHKAIRKSN